MIAASYLIDEVRRRLNRYNTSWSKDASVKNICSSLNEAYAVWLKNRMVLFETNSAVRRDLSILEVTNQCFACKKVEHSSNSVYIDIPKEVFQITRRTCWATKETCSSIKERELILIEIQRDDLSEALKDDYIKPSFEWEEALYDEVGRTLVVYPGDCEVSRICIDYVRNPKLIAAPQLTEETLYDTEGKKITSEFGLELDNGNQQYEILDLATFIMLRDLGDKEDYQTQINKILTLNGLYLPGNTKDK